METEYIICQGQALPLDRGWPHKCYVLSLWGRVFTFDISEVDDSRELLDIPRDQRFLDRPSLEELFTTDIARGSRSRNQKIYDAHVHYSYRQKKISRHLGLHYSTISRIISSVEKKK